MLTPSMRAAAETLKRLPRRLTDTAFYAGLATRTLAIDRELERALDDGIAQVVIIGAGYDSRAWRLARDGVRFIEVDHPATQAVNLSNVERPVAARSSSPSNSPQSL